ncbi:hypothetical protein LZ32DRAFT_610444 [Colletotrichum eremochloae]|nr:hypothetical protein LZ32DRAFT_610444 [Colletotrichum eremochloae]
MSYTHIHYTTHRTTHSTHTQTLSLSISQPWGRKMLAARCASNFAQVQSRSSLHFAHHRRRPPSDLACLSPFLRGCVCVGVYVCTEHAIVSLSVRQRLANATYPDHLSMCPRHRFALASSLAPDLCLEALRLCPPEHQHIGMFASSLATFSM